MTKQEWILMASANLDFYQEMLAPAILERIEGFADLIEQKGYFDSPLPKGQYLGTIPVNNDSK